MKNSARLLSILGAVAFSHLCPAQTPGSLLWSSGPNLSSARAEAVAILSPDDAVILLGGTGPAGATAVSRLYTGAASWDTAPALDMARLSPGAAHAGPGILVIGGKNGTQPTDEVLNYDDLLGDSQDAAKMTTPRQQFAFGTDGSGNAYAVGGRGSSGQALANAEMYDPGADEWSSIAPLPAARYGAAAAGVGGTHLYVFGGATNGVVGTNCYRYTFATESWATIASLPVAVRNASAVFAENGRVYVTGGISATGTCAVVQFYDLNTGLWSLDTPLPAARSHHGAVLDSEGRLVIAGGYDTTGTASVSVWRSQQLNVPETAPVFTSSPVTSASADHFYTYGVAGGGNPSPIFSLVSGPAGMSVDATSGFVTWQPLLAQVGSQSVTLRATNRVGYVDQSFTITVLGDTIAPTAPTNVSVVNVTASSVELSWSGATDAVGVHHYAIFRQYRCGFHGIQRCYAQVLGNITGTTAIVSNLPALTSYNYTIKAYDAAGNVSLNSRLVSFKTLSPPTSFRYAGATTLPANFPLQLQFYANANPAATFSLVSGPVGLTLDAVTGVATWTPTPGNVGTNTVVVRADNGLGTVDLSVTITVVMDGPQLSMQFVPGAGGARDAVAGSPWTARVLDGSHTPSTFALISAPAGMTLDAATGWLAWTPSPTDAGLKSVLVRATNAVDTADITFEFYSHFTGPVANIQVTGLTDLIPTATWTAPTGTGADRVAGYTVVATSRHRVGRAWRTQRLTFLTDGADPTITLPGLNAGRTYSLFVNAVDEFDNRGLGNSPAVTFVPRPALPTIGWSVTNSSGGSAVVAGQQTVVQLTNYNSAFGPTTYSLLSAPTGFVLNATSGTVTWTPTAADVGNATIALRAVNPIATRDLTNSIIVYFSGPVRNLVATRAGDNASASWAPPTDNVAPVVSYRVTRHWQVSSRSYSSTMVVADNNVSFALVPTGAVWHKGVTVAPVDAAGRGGVSTVLSLYNNALPAGMPPAEPAWIESLSFATNDMPELTIRGNLGQSLQVEVSDDMELWVPAGEATIGGDGTVLFQDSEGTGISRAFYRLVIP